jgi:hypothetical protein
VGCGDDSSSRALLMLSWGWGCIIHQTVFATGACARIGILTAATHWPLGGR